MLVWVGSAAQCWYGLAQQHNAGMMLAQQHNAVSAICLSTGAGIDAC
jgi:hypothetical protein